MKRIINGIPMWVHQVRRGKGLYWYGTSINPLTGKQRTHYLGKHLPPESALADPDAPFPDDGLFRCCRCGGHPCTDELFVICDECYSRVRPPGRG